MCAKTNYFSNDQEHFSGFYRCAERQEPEAGLRARFPYGIYHSWFDFYCRICVRLDFCGFRSFGNLASQIPHGYMVYNP
jgi:hypothetical protein